MANNFGNKKTMAKNLQRLMNESEKTRMDVCKDLGIKYTTFTDWIKAKTYPRIDRIELLAQYFHVSKSDLIEEPGYELDWDSTIDEDEYNDPVQDVFKSIAPYGYSISSCSDYYVLHCPDDIVVKIPQNDFKNVILGTMEYFAFQLERLKKEFTDNK